MRSKHKKIKTSTRTFVSISTTKRYRKEMKPKLYIWGEKTQKPSHIP